MTNKWDAAHPDKMKLYRAKWLSAHPTYKAQYAEKNRDKIKEYKRDWEAKNKKALQASARARYNEQRSDRLAKAKKRYEMKRDAIKIYSREHRLKNLERYKAMGALWKVENKDKVRDYRHKFKFKEDARWKLRKAVESGRIKKLPCQKCGTSNGLIHGHHPDYSKPLAVIWLCPPCHASEHFDLSYRR